MPINPSIPGQALGGLQRAQPFNPLATLGDLAQLQNYRALQQERQAKAEQEQRALADEEAARQALSSTGGNYRKAAEVLSAQGNPLGLKLQEFATKQDKDAGDALKVHLDNRETSLKVLSQLSSLITDQSSQDAIYRLLNPESQDIAKQALGETYDPARVQRTREILMDQAQRVTARKTALDTFIDSNKEKREQIKALGGFLATANDANEAAQILQQAPSLGIADDVIALFHGKTPEQAAALSLTTKERADISEKTADDARQAAYQAAQLGVSRAQLGVAQGHLAVSQAAEHRLATAAKEAPKLAASVAEKVAGIDQSLAVLKDLERNKNDEWLGPIAGRVSEAKISMPGMTVPEDLARFSAQTATLKNAVVKAITGAQMSEPEAKRIMKQVPEFTDKPEVWAQKLAATRDNMQSLKGGLLKYSGVASEGAPSAVMPPSTVTLTVRQAGQGFTVRAPDGNDYPFKTRAQAEAFVTRAKAAKGS